MVEGFCRRRKSAADTQTGMLWRARRSRPIARPSTIRLRRTAPYPRQVREGGAPKAWLPQPSNGIAGLAAAISFTS
jgi:hypothetical protein